MNDSLASLSSARWRRLIPIAFITYSFAYVDRSNYSIGAAGGLVDKLHITSGQSGLLGGLFFIGYFLFQVPAGSFAERRSTQVLDVLVIDRVGGAGGVAGCGDHLLVVAGGPIPARRGRGGGAARHARLPLPLVQQIRTRPGRHISHPWQPGHPAVDVGGVGLPRCGVSTPGQS